MQSNFTGNSRRLRQVNLSGRPSQNAWTAKNASGSTNAVATAQQERERRQRERDKLSASQTIQRRWRGYNSRRRCKQQWRQDWDKLEHGTGPDPTTMPYTSEVESVAQLMLLSHFFSPAHPEDVERLRLFLCRQALMIKLTSEAAKDGPLPQAYVRMLKLILMVLQEQAMTTGNSVDVFYLERLKWIITRVPVLSEQDAQSIYQTLAKLVRRYEGHSVEYLTVIIECAIAPLQSIYDREHAAYKAFALEFLILPELARKPIVSDGLNMLSKTIDLQLLAKAIVNLFEHSNAHRFNENVAAEHHTPILAYLIYFHRQAKQLEREANFGNDKDYISAVSLLLSSVAADATSHQGMVDDHDVTNDTTGAHFADAFFQEQILSLVDGDSISSFLGKSNNAAASPAQYGKLDDDAKHLASFALTLMRFFPQKADDIRMQLYRGSAASIMQDAKSRTPAIIYFWQVAKATSVFREISSDLGSVIHLLRPERGGVTLARETKSSCATMSMQDIQDDWRVVLIFLELYTFVLRVMDDEEFFSAAGPNSALSSGNWASQNALPLDDVKRLIVFLKNVGFSVYYNAFALSNYEPERPRDQGSLTTYFKLSMKGESREELDTPEQVSESTVAGLAGITVDYAKGIVTGLLRMLYERDSRRSFVPKGHWLMTSHLDMIGFISSVVEEDEKRRQMLDEDEDEDVDQDQMDEDDRDNVIGASHTNRLRQQEKLRNQQRKLARNKFLAGVAPRLEIMQTMPFFIPFETRVTIFREFVKLDQIKRRGGSGDAETWRFNTMHNPDLLHRHHARIRRERVFEDAYKQFDSLGDGLKEPIQITFVDAFDNEEAGIDGGGVTKEFLTSITKEAFTPIDHGLSMFVENQNHMLYPNPTAVEEIRESVQGSPEAQRTAINNLLRRYEFVGRIIGKCLYEGILVDVSFASFFLLKWALTSLDGSATRESSYRANLNDLKDMDEDLYKGMLVLKNDPGDVSEYNVDFTIGEAITTNYDTGSQKIRTVNLRPNGSHELVTNANRLLYISFVARHRLQVQPARQTAAFLRGLSDMIKPSWLNMFNQSELQTLIGGTSSAIDVDDLKRNTECSGVFQPGTEGEHPTIQMFWEVMNEFSDAERRAVLKFVTSTPRAPLLGFKSLIPKFTIRDSGRDQMRLPSASTCVNLLKLPMYSRKDVLRAKLLKAVESGAGFDLS